MEHIKDFAKFEADIKGWLVGLWEMFEDNLIEKYEGEVHEYTEEEVTDFGDEVIYEYWHTYLDQLENPDKYFEPQHEDKIGVFVRKYLNEFDYHKFVDELKEGKFVDELSDEELSDEEGSATAQA